MRDFEYDTIKSLKNKEKHGICFEEGQKVWNDLDCVELEAKTINELRFYKIGLYNDKLWAAFFTERNSKIRIISIRRARKEEKELYDREKDNRRRT